MKRIAIFFTIVILIVAGVAYMVIYHKIDNAQLQKENEFYENYYNRELNGADIGTLINKAIDNNKKNGVETDKKGKYINNGETSINIDLKMVDDNDKIYNMEQFYKNGIMNFVQYYGSIYFKCTRIEYHNKTGKVSYMYLEQVTK